MDFHPEITLRFVSFPRAAPPRIFANGTLAGTLY
jgi:hypothetical protein